MIRICAYLEAIEYRTPLNALAKHFEDWSRQENRKYQEHKVVVNTNE